MKLWVAAVVVICILAVPAASASPAGAPSPATAAAAFGRLLHQLYGGIDGHWTCPRAVLDRVDCVGEVHTGRQWHWLTMSAVRRNGVVVLMTLTNKAAQSWARRWSPYSRHFILRSAEPGVPGIVSVNSPVYDWGWLAGLVKGLKAGQTGRFSSVDGPEYGAGRLYTFTCARRGGLITCRNALGDAMRYRPGAKG